jgi:hypothetical protein
MPQFSYINAATPTGKGVVTLRRESQKSRDTFTECTFYIRETAVTVDIIKEV